MKTKVESKKAQWLNKYRESIDLDPFFQRGTVWNKGKQQYFIDSLLRKWGTPKIFLWQDEKDSYACLDGKQRLTSLFAFMSDDLLLGPKSIGFAGKQYSQLPRNIQDCVDAYKFSVEVVTNATPDEVVELYKRLQGGTPLNFGEKLFAYPGKMTEFIKKRLVTKRFFKGIVGLANTRYSHYAVAAQLSLLTVTGAKEDLKLKNLEKFFSDYAEFDTSSPEAQKIVLVIKLLEKAFSNKKDASLRNRANVVSAFYLMSDLSARGNIAGRERDIATFFQKFVKDLHGEFSKDPIERDSVLISYQSAVTQGADKIKSIAIRHKILLDRLAAKNTFFQKLLYPPSPTERLKSMYEAARKKVGARNPAAFEKWLMNNKGLKRRTCKNDRGAPETFVGHIRHSIHHPDHGTFSTESLSKATRVLEELLR